MKTAVSEAKERTVGDLIEDIRKARRWLGPKNTAGLVLRECEHAVSELAGKITEARAEIARLAPREAAAWTEPQP